MRYQKILLIALTVFTFFSRLYLLDAIPPGLYDDEVSIGYNAYSVLNYGVDEYQKSYPLFFKAFGEYKLPVMIYSDIFSFILFGKNEFAVRFPAAFFGAITILVLYLFIKALLSLEKEETGKKWEMIPFLSSFMLAITPWHLQFSRVAYEATIALFLYTVALWQFTQFYKSKNLLYLFLSLICLSLTVYTYNAYRLFAPLTIAFLFILLWKKQLIKEKKQFVYCFLLLLFINTPIIFFSLSPEGIIRFSQTSAFTKFASLPFFEKMLMSIITFITNYVSYFSPRYFFLPISDVRFYISSDFGLLFRWQLPFLIAGIFFLLRQHLPVLKTIMLLLLVSTPLTASLTISPNPLRVFIMVIPLSVITAFGILAFINQKKLWKKSFLFGILLVSFYEVFLYAHTYLTHYPNTHRILWGGAEKEIVKQATEYHKQYDTIVIKEHFFPNQRIHFLFYNNQLSPIFVQENWMKPITWHNKKILYITYPLKSDRQLEKKLLKNIQADTPNKDIVAQFWEL